MQRTYESIPVFRIDHSGAVDVLHKFRGWSGTDQSIFYFIKFIDEDTHFDGFN